MSEIGIEETADVTVEDVAPLLGTEVEPPGIVLPEPSKANERKIADLRAHNRRAMQRLLSRQASPHPVAVLAARVRALLALAPDGGDALAASESIDNMQVLTNAIEGLCMIQVGPHPGLRQAFDLAFEEQMEKLLKDVESKVNQAMLQSGMQPPGAPEVRSRGGLILPHS